jgi:hypothetical protein
MAFQKKKGSLFIESVAGQPSIPPSLEFKSKEVLQLYSAAPKTPLTLEDISSKYVA